MHRMNEKQKIKIKQVHFSYFITLIYFTRMLITINTFTSVLILLRIRLLLTLELTKANDMEYCILIHILNFVDIDCNHQKYSPTLLNKDDK